MVPSLPPGRRPGNCEPPACPGPAGHNDGHRPDRRMEHEAMRLSARNKIPARVTSITSGEATANVELDAGGVRLVASITTEAAAELGLAEGMEVVAIVKASD